MGSSALPIGAVIPHFEAVTGLGLDRLTVHLSGELDIATRSMLCRALSQANMHDVSTVFVDLAELEYIDSTGVGALVDASNMLCAEARELVVLHPAPLVARVITLAGATDLLEGSAPRDGGHRGR